MGVYSGAGVYGGFGGASGGDAPGGAAGGDLSGTYPNPAVAQITSGLLMFAGATLAFPALKRNGVNLEVRLADDSGYSGLTVSNIVATAGTLTTSQPLTLTQTWNAGGVTFTGLLANMTSTASAAASLLADFQLAGASVFRVTKNNIRLNGQNTGFTADPNLYLTVDGTDMLLFDNVGKSRGLSNFVYGWTSGGVTSSVDTGLARAGAASVKVTDGSTGGASFITADPTSGLGPAHKFGAVKAAVSALDTANYWEVSIGGVTKKVALVT